MEALEKPVTHQVKHSVPEESRRAEPSGSATLELEGLLRAGEGRWKLKYDRPELSVHTQPSSSAGATDIVRSEVCC